MVGLVRAWPVACSMARMKMAPYPYPDSLLEPKLPALQSTKGLSRLEAMRSEYQERSLRAKEEKMVTLLNQQQERITQRLNGTLSRIKQPQEQNVWAPEEREWASNWTVAKRSAGVDRAHPLKPVSHHQASMHPASATGIRHKVTPPGQELVRSKSGPSRPTTWQQLERKESNLEAEIRRKEALLLEKLRRTEEELRRIQREKAEAVLEERSGHDRDRWKEEHGEQEEAELGEERVPCQMCGRRFMAQRLEKHMQICQKMQTSTRKVFDSSKARAKGTDLEQFLRNQGKRPVQDPEVKGSSWRQKHESFMRTIRQARVVQNVIARGGKVSELPPPPPEENPDYETCPHCSRRFAPRAAERHIPKCATIKNKPRPPPARRR
ncbi:zinc finger C2HC domain-containing protein 1C [Gastrophryne carolinensis]